MPPALAPPSLTFCVSLAHMSHALTLPAQYDRKFSLWLYWKSHGLLLLRSNKTSRNFTRIDILFCDVRAMALPAGFDGLRIENGQLSEIPFALTDELKKEAQYMSVFRLISQGINHCVL